MSVSAGVIAASPFSGRFKKGVPIVSFGRGDSLVGAWVPGLFPPNNDFHHGVDSCEEARDEKPRRKRSKRFVLTTSTEVPFAKGFNVFTMLRN